MLYKPKFCCNCGEKIERTDWRIFTSRRFCDVCAIEQKGNELFPRVLVSIAVLFGVFGIGSFFQSRGDGSADNERHIPNSAASRRGILSETRSDRRVSDQSPRVAETAGSETQPIGTLRTEGSVAVEPKEQPKIRKIASDGPEYYCGALTKKGKPCSRKVKSNERCWQHLGQPVAPISKKQSDAY